MKKLASAFALTSVLFFASCEKDDKHKNPEPGDEAKTKIQLLQDGSWNMDNTHIQIRTNDSLLNEGYDRTPGIVTFLSTNKLVFAPFGRTSDTVDYIFFGDSIAFDDIMHNVNVLESNRLILESQEVVTLPNDSSSTDSSFSFSVITTMSLKR